MMAILDKNEASKSPGLAARRLDSHRWRGLEARDNQGLPIWKPWFEHMKTSYELGLAHGKEDRAEGVRFHYRSGCLMTSEEYADYRQGYGDGWKSEHSPMEF